ncbi:hypothetical protein [uncultured Nostoc sp.]|uniref:hypothetical protein n=1 Tax=uncultured Nostoc sp. TaxID=340711 RepID=UPI0035CA3663
MNTLQYFSRKIKALTDDKPEIPEVSRIEELSDSETSKIVGGKGYGTIEGYQVDLIQEISTIGGFNYQIDIKD